MKLSQYQSIAESVRCHGSNPKGIQHICKLYPQFSVRTIGSIFSQVIQKKVKKSHHRHHKPEKQDIYYDRYQSRVRKGCKNVILKMAEEIDFSPALLARIIIDRYVMYTECDGDLPPKPLVSSYLKNPSTIKDGRLAQEVFSCVVADQVYGPCVDVIKHSVGQEYEVYLKYRLDKLRLSYWDEHVLRDKGYDKTPDVKLLLPIAVNGKVINWIESKASFGDEDSHKGYLKDQFWSYWNRFGAGLVIYWFGFIEEEDRLSEKGIYLMDHFPDDDEIDQMDPLSLLPVPFDKPGMDAAQRVDFDATQNDATLETRFCQEMETRSSERTPKNESDMLLYSGSLASNNLETLARKRTQEALRSAKRNRVIRKRQGNLSRGKDSSDIDLSESKTGCVEGKPSSQEVAVSESNMLFPGSVSSPLTGAHNIVWPDKYKSSDLITVQAGSSMTELVSSSGETHKSSGSPTKMATKVQDNSTKTACVPSQDFTANKTESEQLALVGESKPLLSSTMNDQADEKFYDCCLQNLAGIIYSQNKFTPRSSYSSPKGHKLLTVDAKKMRNSALSPRESVNRNNEQIYDPSTQRSPKITNPEASNNESIKSLAGNHEPSDVAHSEVSFGGDVILAYSKNQNSSTLSETSCTQASNQGIGSTISSTPTWASITQNKSAPKHATFQKSSPVHPDGHNKASPPPGSQPRARSWSGNSLIPSRACHPSNQLNISAGTSSSPTSSTGQIVNTGSMWVNMVKSSPGAGSAAKNNQANNPSASIISDWPSITGVIALPTPGSASKQSASTKSAGSSPTVGSVSQAALGSGSSWAGMVQTGARSKIATTSATLKTVETNSYNRRRSGSGDVSEAQKSSQRKGKGGKKKR